MLRFFRLLQIVLLVSYPIVAHMAVYWHLPELALIILGLLIISYIQPYFKSNYYISTSVLVGIIAMVVSSIFYQSIALLYLPPIVISAFMLWVFAKTLLPKQEPLITTFARVIYHENSPEVIQYTKKVTQIWSLFFLGMLLETILLSLFATPKIWSLFCNILNYLFIGLLFLIEGIYRQFRFHLPNPFVPLFKYFAKNGIYSYARKPTKEYPLIAHDNLQAIFAVKDGKPLTCQDFLSDVLYLEEHLTEAKYVINLCEDRYYFAVLFACTLLRQQTTILPNNASTLTLQQLQAEFANSVILDNDYISNILETPHDKSYKTNIPTINAEQLAAILYTSGSTGKPMPWKKYWGELVEHSQITARALGLEKNKKIYITATVAAQHMYGLEHSVILPMQMGFAFNTRKPFFLEDIRTALSFNGYESILFSTPLHLKLCVESQASFPPVKFIVSATAKLTAALAIACEKTFNTSLIEIYGCTESGCIATRRTSFTEQWRLINGYQLSQEHGIFFVIPPNHLKKIMLSDQLNIIDQEHFLLMGRLSENINIAGKRMSLSDLNIKLTSINGVEDGIFYCPTEETEDTRVAAIVVAPTLSTQEIKTQLRQMIDPVFLPRPLIKVEKLPRNEMGKINMEDLKHLIQAKNPSL